MALEIKKGREPHRHPDAKRLRDQPMKRLTVNIPEDLHRRLKLQATSKDKQMSEIVLDLVNQYLDGTISTREKEDHPDPSQQTS